MNVSYASSLLLYFWCILSNCLPYLTNKDEYKNVFFSVAMREWGATLCSIQYEILECRFWLLCARERTSAQCISWREAVGVIKPYLQIWFRRVARPGRRGRDIARSPRRSRELSTDLRKISRRPGKPLSSDLARWRQRRNATRVDIPPPPTTHRVICTAARRRRNLARFNSRSSLSTRRKSSARGDAAWRRGDVISGVDNIPLSRLLSVIYFSVSWHRQRTVRGHPFCYCDCRTRCRTPPVGNCRRCPSGQKFVKLKEKKVSFLWFALL